MSYRFEADEPLADAVRRVAREQTDKAIASAAEPGELHERVHDVAPAAPCRAGASSVHAGAGASERVGRELARAGAVA